MEALQERISPPLGAQEPQYRVRERSWKLQKEMSNKVQGASSSGSLEGLGFSLGVGVQGLGVRVQDLRFRV